MLCAWPESRLSRHLNRAQPRTSGCSKNSSATRGRDQKRFLLLGKLAWAAASTHAPAQEPAAEGIEMLRMLAYEQRLRGPIARLLFQVGPHRRAPIVPHKSGGAESDLETLVLQPPANVHVVSRPAENRIEQPDLL